MAKITIAALAVALVAGAGDTHAARPLGTATVVTQSPGGGAVGEPVAEGEVEDVAVQGDQIVGRARLALGEAAVIVQLLDTPLILQRGAAPAALVAARADRERTIAAVKDAILRLEVGARSARGLAAPDARSVLRYAYRHVFTGVAVRVLRENLPAIARLPGVKRVLPDRKMQALLTESVPRIRANLVWSSLGVTGAGKVIAIVDTGIDYTHPDLGGCLGPGCKVQGGYDFVGNDADPTDDNGHGTHVAGIAAANGAVRGVAPDAHLMAFKVLDAQGDGTESQVMAGVERATDPDENPATDDAADVVNLSLGGPGDPDDALAQAVDNAVAGGVVVVCAAGNSGPAYETVGSPAVARRAIAVGASDDLDQIAYFSSRGPAPTTYHIKPEVLAPGVSIVSTVPAGGCLLCDPSGYRSLDGTSMASPHVAGTAALLLQRFPSWTPDQVRDAITQQSVDVALDAFTQGSGRLDAYSAATAPALANPANVSLGLDDISQPAFASHYAMNLTNLASASRTYRLSVTGSFPAGMTVTVTPASLALGAGQTRTFAVDVSVNNTTVANPQDPPYAYEGQVLAQRGAGTVRLPLALVKSPVLELTFDENPFVLMVHDRALWQRFISFPGTSRQLLVPAGTYDVSTLFSDATTRVVREGVDVTTRTAISIARSDAVHPLTIVPIDETGAPLFFQRPLTISRFVHKATGTGDILTWFGGAPTTFQLSPLSNAYVFETTLLENRSSMGGPD